MADIWSKKKSLPNKQKSSSKVGLTRSGIGPLLSRGEGPDRSNSLRIDAYHYAKSDPALGKSVPRQSGHGWSVRSRGDG
jgi:hypothetical protein